MTGTFVKGQHGARCGRGTRIVAALVAAGVACGAALAAGGPYRLVNEIRIGGAGGWDYLSVDAQARRLYVTHASRVVVVDLDTGKVVGEVADTPGVHGFALAPELGLGFASNGASSQVAIVDLKTLKTVATVPTGENPDAILYVPATAEVYAFNGRGHSATVFEARTGKVTATVPLPGKPEFAVLDPAAGRVYNNIEDTSQLAVIDVKTRKLVATWPIAPGEAASGLAIDLERHRLFLGCDNRMMVMMDATDGRVLATAPIGEGVDGCAFDPGSGLAFASCGDGTLTIVREETPGKLAVVQTLVTARSARTITLDETTHRVYLPAADFAPVPPAAPGAPRQRPQALPGTFRVLVAAPK